MGSGRVRNYRDLKVWQRAKAFAGEIYRVTEDFPRKEQYSLTDQIRRAAVSIPSNVAEGHIQRSDKVFARHLDIALGSAAELSTQLEIALEIKYLQPETHRECQVELEEIIKMLFGLRAAVLRG